MSSKRHMKRTAVMAVLLVLCMLIAACSGGTTTPAGTSAGTDKTTESAKPADDTKPAGEDKPAEDTAPAADAELHNSKKELIRTWGGFPALAKFTGHYQSSTGIGEMGGFIIEGAYRFVRSTDAIYPRLAEDMPVHEGNKSTVKIRQGVLYNDGTELKAKDIWSYYMINKDVRINSYLTGVEATDDYTLVYTWQEPVPSEAIRTAFIAENTDNACVPYHVFSEFVEKHVALLAECPDLTDANKRGPFGKDVTAKKDDFAANWTAYQSFEIPNKKPIGTGPYVLDTMTDTEFILTKRADYFRADEIQFDIIHNIVVTGEQGIAMLKNAKTDSYPGSLPLDIAESVLKSNKDIVFYQMDDPACHGFYFNQKSSRVPMDKMEFRQAINYIVDKKPAREAGNYYGTEYPFSSTGIPPGTVASAVSPDVQGKMRQYGKDWAKAEELLGTIGITKGSDGKFKNADGSDLKIILGVNSGWQPAGVVTNVTSIVADQLKAFGIDAEVLAVESSVFGTMMDGNEDFDMAFEWIDVAWGYLMPYFPLFNFYQSAATRQGTEKDADGKIVLKLKDWDGVEFDVTDYLNKIPVTNDEAEVQLMVDRLVWAANEYAFGINLYQNATGVWENRADVKNLPMEDMIDSGTNGFPQWIVQPTDRSDPNFARIAELNWGFAGIQKMLGPDALAPR